MSAAQLDLFAPVGGREPAPAAAADRPIPAESAESGAAVSGSLPESTVRRAVRRPRRPAGTSPPHPMRPRAPWPALAPDWAQFRPGAR